MCLTRGRKVEMFPLDKYHPPRIGRRKFGTTDFPAPDPGRISFGR